MSGFGQFAFGKSPFGALPTAIPDPTGPIALFPALPQGYPIKVTLSMDTVIGTTKSLREMRVAQQSYPVWDFELLFEELKDCTQNQTAKNDATLAELNYQQLVELWLSSYGTTNLFAFDCPWDNSRNQQPIGFGDGVTTDFLLVTTWGQGTASATRPIGVINAVEAVYVSGTLLPSSDYTVSRNMIGFVSPPAAGSAIAVTFSYYYLCRFLEDEQDFEEFAFRRWAVNSLKFRAGLWLPPLAPA